MLGGSAHVVRGDYDFAGKRFQFDNRGTVSLATSADDIRLDLTATRDDPSLTAVIRIEGTAAKPKITLTSTPVLPNDEVLSQVLFGLLPRSASPARPSPPWNLALGHDLACRRLRFSTWSATCAQEIRPPRPGLALGGDTTGAIVSGGKYATDNIYLEVTGGANGPTGAVEWRIRKDLSLISRIAGSVGRRSQIEVPLAQGLLTAGPPRRLTAA